MAFTYYPDTVSSTLYPVTYRNTQTSADSLFVEVMVDGTEVGSYHAQPYSGLIFDLDVSGFVATNVSPYLASQTSVFGTLNDFYRSLNIIDCFKTLTISVYAENITSAGFLQTSTAAETSTATYIAPIDFYGNQSSLEQFQQVGSGDMYFLTAMREARNVRDTDNAYLSYLIKGTDSAQFIFYNANSSAISFPVLDMVNTSADYGQQTFSVGLANILGQTTGGGLVFHEGAFPTTSNGIAFYTVSVGTYNGSYTQESEALQFNVVPDCDDKLEIHWFGVHGGAEAFVFTGLIRDSWKIGGELVNVATAWNVQGAPRMNTYNKKIIRTDTTRNKERRVTVEVTHEEAQYIATLFSSPEIYINEAGLYVAVAIENGEFVTDDNRSTGIEISFTIVYNNRPVQRL